jgi:MFS family permease
MSDSAAAAPARQSLVFRNRGFTRFILARLSSQLASTAQTVGIGWYIYDLTDSALALGLLGLAQFAPGLGLVLVTGLVADRFDRKSILIVCWAVECACLVTLIVFVATGGVAAVWLYAVVALFSAARAFEHPTGSAILPNLVPPEEFPRAVAVSAASRQYGNIAGPLLGGVIYAFGPAAVFAVSGGLFILAMVLLQPVQPRVYPTTVQKVDIATLFAGFAFVRHQPVMLGAISLDLFAVLLGGATSLMPIFARDILEAGPWALGALRAAPSAGAFLVSTFMVFRPIDAKAGAKMFAAVACFGLATIAFGLSTNLWLSLLALVALGAADGVSVVIRQTIIQLATPDEMRGRVGAINAVFISTSNSLGDFQAGVVASLIGAVAAVVVGGVGAVVVAAACIRLFPELWRVDSLTRRQP